MTASSPRRLPGGRVPIVTWATDLDHVALEQATNVSNLAIALDHVALMPDAHAGYGMPIGGVLFADAAVVPFAIGVDIGCGVALAETDLTIETLATSELEDVLEAIDLGVPTGFQRLPAAVDRDVAEAALEMPRPASVAAAWFEQSLAQLGTLGGGNHFLEIQRDETGAIAVMLHSGSRHLGKTICDEFHRRALEHDRAAGLEIPHRELAYLPRGTSDFDGYWAAMTFALRYAEVNRSRMLDVVERAFAAHTKIGRFERTVDIHHNYAAWEHHAGMDGLVHRKGAVRARVGETVLIPGSMGSASYVGVGLGDPDAFESCQHGAGRAMSRKAARRAKSSRQVFDEMAALGVVLRSSEPRGVAEEAAFAYKDVDAVMTASGSLVRPVRRLTPLGVVKG
ncbi:MAG: RtcB family protein [Chloroflexota bacterium]|jgi:tRNA-splicing ligase RtcB|nr:RtcB family protein [Chloroflexota bacterium]MDH5242387.1 RtcB family protein [Chloroflexota bacterium]